MIPNIYIIIKSSTKQERSSPSSCMAPLIVKIQNKSTVNSNSAIIRIIRIQFQGMCLYQYMHVPSANLKLRRFLLEHIHSTSIKLYSILYMIYILHVQYLPKVQPSFFQGKMQEIGNVKIN